MIDSFHRDTQGEHSLDHGSPSGDARQGTNAAGGIATTYVGLITVHTAPEILERALAVAGERSWLVQDTAFDAYISQHRRPHFIDSLRNAQHCVALIDFDSDPEQAVEAAQFLKQMFADRLVLMALSSSPDSALLLQAMRAGCTEVLSSTPTETEFADAFQRVERYFARSGAAVRIAGSVAAFYGAKGGVGTTTLAVHLAAYLAQYHGKRVVLVDSHFQFGHACIYLNIDGAKFHFQDLVRNLGRMDSELLRGFVANHSSGLHVLSSPDTGQVAYPMHPEDVAGTLEFLRGEYDFVLVDCSSALDEINRAVIDASSLVYIVATPELSAIRDLSRYADELTVIDHTASKIRVIINRYSSQFAVGLEIIEQAIRLPVNFSIPNAFVDLVRSANLGEVISLESRSAFGVEIDRWARTLIGGRENSPSAEAATSAGKLLPISRATKGKGLFGLSLPHFAHARKSSSR